MLDIERLLFNFVARAYSLWSVLVGVALVILDQEVYSPSLLNNPLITPPNLPTTSSLFPSSPFHLNSQCGNTGSSPSPLFNSNPTSLTSAENSEFIASKRCMQCVYREK